MKEKYASYYKKLRCFQDTVENPENEGEQNFMKGAFILNKEIATVEDYTKAWRRLTDRQRTQSIKKQCRNRHRNTTELF